MRSELKAMVLGEEFMDLLDEPVAFTTETVDTEALGESLEANLNAQAALYHDYLEIANRQKLALVNNRAAQSADANSESEQVLFALGNLEAERLSLVDQIIATRPGMARPAAQVKCEALYPFFSAALASRVKAARNSLLKIVDELKRVTAVNQALIENGSRIVHTTIGIMTSVVGRGRNEAMAKTYTKKGAINVGKVQVRNLINRSV